VSRPDVTVIILHPEPAASAGPLTRALAAARRRLAETHRRGFLAAGAGTVEIVSDPSVGASFGARLRSLVAGPVDRGLVVLGSGAIPLARHTDRRAFVEAAASATPGALANNRYSADIIAIAGAREVLREVPGIASDNALPRWLWESGGIRVDDLRGRWRLAIDIDSPLDLAVLGGRWRSEIPVDAGGPVMERMTALRRLASDPSAELIVAGRSSGATLAWLERHTAGRTRALVEERGLRTSRVGQRPASSALGLLLERDGPESLGQHLARLGEGAVIDSRVLLAHRFGADETSWPLPEDRYASDLLLHDRITDPWLRDLTRAAADASIPVILGGHTLVGPGVRLLLGRGR